MAIAIIISRHWIGITLDSQIPSYWIALIMRILDGSILPVHEPERQTMDCVDSRALIGNRCDFRYEEREKEGIEMVSYSVFRRIKGIRTRGRNC
jgi:hypothetical protein